MNNIIKYVTSDTAVILATGSSVNLITNEQWDKLKTFDMWGINNWIYHPSIVPKFYHMEIRYDEVLMRSRIAEKWELYKNVLWLVQRGRANITSCIDHPNEARILSYESVKSQNKAYGVTSLSQFVRYHNSSVTLVLDILYKIGYKHIIMAGIDLYNSKYFWSNGDTQYGKVHINYNKQGDGKTIEDVHQVYVIKDFILEMNEKFMKPAGREMFILNTDTALHPGLRLYEC